MSAKIRPRNVEETTEEHCYLCGRSVRELEAMSKTLGSPVFDWVIEEVSARIKMLDELQEKIQELLALREDSGFKDHKKAEDLFDDIIWLSWVDPHAKHGRGGSNSTIYGEFTDVEDERDDKKLETALSRVVADSKTLREALDRFKKEREKASPGKLGLHHVAVPIVMASDLPGKSNENWLRANEIGKEFDTKFTHAEIGWKERSISLTLDNLHYNEHREAHASRVDVIVCSVCMRLLQKAPPSSDDWDYDDDSGHDYSSEDDWMGASDDWDQGGPENL